MNAELRQLASTLDFDDARHRRLRLALGDPASYAAEYAWQVRTLRELVDRA